VSYKKPKTSYILERREYILRENLRKASRKKNDDTRKREPTARNVA
jgi:hypothetical protein